MKNLRKTLDKIGEKAAAAKHKQFLKDLSKSGWEDSTYRNDTNISIGYGEDLNEWKFWFVPMTDDEGGYVEFNNKLNSKMVKDAFDGDDIDEWYFQDGNVFDKKVITSEDFDEIVQNLEELDDEYTSNKKLDKVLDALQKMVADEVGVILAEGESGESWEGEDLSKLKGSALVKKVNEITSFNHEESVTHKSDFARWM